jgi:hypothetical protein
MEKKKGNVIIKKSPRERCEYFMKITKHYLDSRDTLMTKDYANQGWELAKRHGLTDFEQKFAEILGRV